MLYPDISNAEILKRSVELAHLNFEHTPYFDYYTRYKLYEGYHPDRTFDERCGAKKMGGVKEEEEEKKENHNPCVDKTKVFKGSAMFDQMVLSAAKNKFPPEQLDGMMALYNIIPGNIMNAEFIRVSDVLNITDPAKPKSAKSPLTSDQKKKRAVEKTLKEFDKVCLSLM
jgi:hypothetical protein